MIPFTTLAPLVALAALAGTALADTKSKYGGFVSMCDRDTIRMCSNSVDVSAGRLFLCAACYNDNTKALDRSVVSRLDLNRCVSNVNGALSWQNNGSFARAGSSRCQVHSVRGNELTVNLQCDCEDSSPGSVVPIETAVLNLNDGIHVHDGQLVCYEHEGSNAPASAGLPVRRRHREDVASPQLPPGIWRNTEYLSKPATAPGAVEAEAKTETSAHVEARQVNQLPARQVNQTQVAPTTWYYSRFCRPNFGTDCFCCRMMRRRDVESGGDGYAHLEVREPQ